MSNDEPCAQLLLLDQVDWAGRPAPELVVLEEFLPQEGVGGHSEPEHDRTGMVAPMARPSRQQHVPDAQRSVPNS